MANPTVGELQAAIVDLRAQLTFVLSQIATMTADVATCADCSHVVNRVTALEACVARLQAQIDTLTAEIDALNGVTPPPPAPDPQTINSFSADTSSITIGDAVFLTWSTSNASAVRLNGVAVATSATLQRFTPVVNTAYTLEVDGAVATISRLVSVSVVAAPVAGQSAADLDFIARSTAPGVVRSFHYNDATQLGGNYQSNFGRLGGRPVLDTSIKASGASAIRFDVAAQTFDYTQAWFCNVSPTYEQFGENETVYVQWRQRFNQAFIDALLELDVGDGPDTTNWSMKLFMFGAGTIAGQADDGNSSYATSCSANEVVPTTRSNGPTKYPQVYHRCPGAPANQGPLYENPWHGDAGSFGFQNAMPAPFCASGTTPAAGCFLLRANEWMTFKLMLQIGPRSDGASWLEFGVPTPKYEDSVVKLWGAREGQPSQLLIDWNPSTPGYFPLNAHDPDSPTGFCEFGKIWLTPYQTSKSMTQVHDLLQIWYDELIISTQDIADPAVPTNTTLQAQLTGANTSYNIAAFNPADPVGETAVGQSVHICDYSGMQYDANRQQMVILGGGHASTNNDGLLKFPLTNGGLTWSYIYNPTPRANWVYSNFDTTKGAWLAGASGPYPRPLARHSLDLNVVVGNQFIVCAKVEGNLPNLVGDWSASPGYAQTAGATDHYVDLDAPQVAHFNFIAGTWSWAAASIFTALNSGVFPAAAYDPVGGKIWIIGNGLIETYDPATRVKTVIYDVYTGVGGNPFRDESGALAPAVSIGGNQNLIYYPPNQNMYYFLETGSVYEVVLNRTAPSCTLTRQTVTGSVPISTERGVAYDSTNRLIGMGPFSNMFHTYSPIAQGARAAKSWTSQAIPGSPGTLNFHCIDYDPMNNCYIFITTAFRTWAYRWA